MALTLGPPTWGSNTWGTDAWGDGTWDVTVSAAAGGTQSSGWQSIVLSSSFGWLFFLALIGRQSGV